MQIRIKRILTEYDSGSHSKEKVTNFKARLGERRKESRRKEELPCPIDERTGLERRFGVDRRFILKPSSSIIKVKSIHHHKP